jgi:hypothetical protein
MKLTKLKLTLDKLKRKQKTEEIPLAVHSWSIWKFKRPYEMTNDEFDKYLENIRKESQKVVAAVAASTQHTPSDSLKELQEQLQKEKRLKEQIEQIKKQLDFEKNLIQSEREKLRLREQIELQQGIPKRLHKTQHSSGQQRDEE